MPAHPTRSALTCAGLAAAVTLMAGAATASPTPGDSTDVSFVSITAHHVLTNAYLAAGHASSPVVIGGATTVPSDATTVRFDVTVKGTGSGLLSIYPAGNAAAGHPYSWVKGGGAEVDAENVGTANEVTFVNRSSSAINLSVTITGYSTQVSEGDLNGSGGTAGQVLTNTGSGGAQWQTPGTVYTITDPAAVALGSTGGPVTSLELDPGSYLLLLTGTVELEGQAATARCELVNGETGTAVTTAWASVSGSNPDTSISLQGVTSLDRSDVVELFCQPTSLTTLREYTLTAVPVGAVHSQN